MCRRKYVKAQSMAMAKHKCQLLVSFAANEKLIDFSDEFQKLSKDAFQVAVKTITEQFIYAKVIPHLNKYLNQVHLENGIRKQSVSHLEKSKG